MLILFLKFAGISYETYNEGGQLIEFWLKPAACAAAAVFALRFAVLFGSSIFVFLLVESGRNEKRENDRSYRHSPMKTTMRLWFLPLDRLKGSYLIESHLAANPHEYCIFAVCASPSRTTYVQRVLRQRHQP